MGVNFVQGLAVGAASVVAVTVLASLTLLPALLGFAGERIERTRWRGLIAAGLVAVALVGVGLKITPLTDRPAAGRHRAHRRLLRRAAQERGPAPGRRSRGARPTAYRWSRVDPAPSVARSHRAARSCCSSWRYRCSALRLGFSDESQLRAGHQHEAGLRPAGRRVRSRLQRTAAPGGRAPRRHEPRRARRRAGGGRGRPGRGLRFARDPQQPGEPDGRALERGADDGTTGQCDHRSREPPTRRRAATGRGRHRCRCRGHRAPSP